MTPSRASGVEPRTEAAYDFEGAEWDDITEREKRTIVQGLYERLHYLNERYLAIEAEATLRQGTPEDGSVTAARDRIMAVLINGDGDTVPRADVLALLEHDADCMSRESRPGERWDCDCYNPLALPSTTEGGRGEP